MTVERVPGLGKAAGGAAVSDAVAPSRWTVASTSSPTRGTARAVARSWIDGALACSRVCKRPRFLGLALSGAVGFFAGCCTDSRPSWSVKGESRAFGFDRRWRPALGERTQSCRRGMRRRSVTATTARDFGMGFPP
jgi:hypothetical protein